MANPGAGKMGGANSKGKAGKAAIMRSRKNRKKLYAARDAAAAVRRQVGTSQPKSIPTGVFPKGKKRKAAAAQIVTRGIGSKKKRA